MRLRIPLLIASLYLIPGVFVQNPGAILAQETPEVPAKTDMVQRPAATEPQTRVPERALFGRLVGTWDVSYEIYDKDGNARRYRGQVISRWILDGAALQEVWTSDAHAKEPKPYGTMIDFFDSKRQRWTAVWIYPAQAMTTVVSGGEVDGRIVLAGRDEANVIQRWSINDIKSDSFIGRYESSTDEGKTWRLLGVNHVHRHPA